MRSWWLIPFLLLGILAVIHTFPSYDEVGIASWYGPGFHGKVTASGELYDMYAFTAAHRTLPFGTVVKVVDLETGRWVVVRINDRGPYVPGRIIDLSYAAAQKLGIVGRGTTKVGLLILKGG